MDAKNIINYNRPDRQYLSGKNMWAQRIPFYFGYGYAGVAGKTGTAPYAYRFARLYIIGDGCPIPAHDYEYLHGIAGDELISVRRPLATDGEFINRLHDTQMFISNTEDYAKTIRSYGYAIFTMAPTGRYEDIPDAGNITGNDIAEETYGIFIGIRLHPSQFGGCIDNNTGKTYDAIVFVSTANPAVVFFPPIDYNVATFEILQFGTANEMNSASSLDIERRVRTYNKGLALPITSSPYNIPDFSSMRASCKQLRADGKGPATEIYVKKGDIRNYPTYNADGAYYLFPQQAGICTYDCLHMVEWTLKIMTH